MLMQKIEYIHNNPIRKNIAVSPGDYPYSSYDHYFGNNRNALGIDPID